MKHRIVGQRAVLGYVLLEIDTPIMEQFTMLLIDGVRYAPVGYHYSMLDGSAPFDYTRNCMIAATGDFVGKELETIMEE